MKTIRRLEKLEKQATGGKRVVCASVTVDPDGKTAEAIEKLAAEAKARKVAEIKSSSRGCGEDVEAVVVEVTVYSIKHLADEMGLAETEDSPEDEDARRRAYREDHREELEMRDALNRKYELEAEQELRHLNATEIFWRGAPGCDWTRRMKQLDNVRRIVWDSATQDYVYEEPNGTK